MIILAVAWATLAQAAAPALPDSVTAEAMFVQAPALRPRVLPEISRGTRLDMLDYFKAGIDKASENNFGGQSKVTAIDSLSMDFELTGDIACQLFVLNAGGRPVTCIVTTYPTPIPDSRLRAYDSNWREVSIFAEPTLADWLIDKKSRKEAELALPFVLASYRYDPATQTLTVANEMDAYWIEAERPAVLEQMHKKLAYRWDGKRFKLIKQ